MASKKRGIAAKFILVVSGLSLVLLVGLAATVIYSAYGEQAEQAHHFIAKQKNELRHQEGHLQEKLTEKVDSVAAILAQTAPGLILGYDFDGLLKLANNAKKDKDIVFVVFMGKDKSVLAEAKSEGGKADKTLSHPVLFEDAPIGFVEIGLTYAAIQVDVDQVAAEIDEQTTLTEAELSEAAWRLGRFIFVATGLIVLVLCFAIHWTLSRFVIRPVGEIISGLEDNAAQVTDSSLQMSGAAHQLAEGASEEAASLEQTSASLEEVSTMARRNADNATECNGLMKEVDTVVKKANQSMAAQTLAMEEISKASEETSKIIKTIDEIAFQTNLLALNAAVEAARAGEAGAGFAVVANEVRNLAMRAAEAARNTAGLIEGTVSKVKEGEVLVEQTNADFGEVAELASKVGTLVGEIAVASNEQTTGLNQVNTAMGEIDRVTQQTAASSEEAASASEELSAQAEYMKKHVHDLAELIGGSKGQGGAPAAKSHGLSKSSAGAKRSPLPALAPPSSGPARKDVKAAKPKKTSGQSSPKPKAAELIPFDDDEFEDF
ncbi:MAG: methyl-accepting chemotaxis protein [Desulfobulbaceae bacterium]|nr:methyl-accepting chemotaxis protein [Desulfobulbaceae bacterium]HIJ79573.1 hypothetical protein [Deltaproteobacteria bacterium]